MDWSADSDNTNYQYFIDTRVSLFGNYIANQVKIFRCPTDDFLSVPQHQNGFPYRCRSVTMNGAVGPGQKWNFGWANVANVNLMSQFTAPTPALAWVIMDEHPDSIDDVQLYVNPNEINGTGTFTELPASYHDGGAAVMFGDGHVETHRWLNSQTTPPVRYIQYVHNVSVTADPDLAWLAQRTPISQ